MTQFPGLARKPQPDWKALLANLRRQGRPGRMFHMELFHDGEIAEAIVERFDLMAGVGRDDPDYERKKLIAVNRFTGMDYVVAGPVGYQFPAKSARAEDTADLKRTGGRWFQDEHTGPIMSWADFKAYPWPNLKSPAALAELEWYQKNLPDDMCIIGGLGAHFAEELSWLMGYETLCFALFDQPDLVEAIAERLREFFREWLRLTLQFDRVRIIWGSDDMGFKTGLLISPNDMRKYVLPGHREQAALAHAAGRLYILHACGKLTDIIEDLVDDVKIDAKHSYEDTIERVTEVKHTYGQRIAIIGGIDVDFLCRSTPDEIRARVRDTLKRCLPGGGYCLGTGNTVANYIPLDNYLAMVDEGRLYGES